MSAGDLFREVVPALNEAGIPHMLVGSFASTSHGVPRATQDIDIVIDPTSDQLEQFVASFDPGRIYVSPAAQEALTSRDQFNLINPATGWKVDLIIRKDRAFSRSEFGRRTRVELFGTEVYVATAEDTILAKLEWAGAGGSDRQVADAAAVLAVRDSLDDSYLDRWAVELGVSELLAQARAG